MQSDEAFDAALAAIPWDRLHHAFGTASDVPQLLYELRSQAIDGSDVEDLISEFFNTIWHQGTVYEATPYAVPLLVDIAADGRCSGRGSILGFLHAIADRAASDDVADRNASEAVAAWYERFVEMTADDDAVVRVGAAHVLAVLPTKRERTAGIIRGLLARAVDENERIGLILELGTSGDRAAETIEALEACAKRDGTERVAAAISLARLQRPMPGDAREALFEWISTYDGSRIADFPWDVEAEHNAEDVAHQLTGADRDELLERLFVPIEAGTAGASHCDQLLALIFDPGRTFEERARIERLSELSPLERRVVLALMPYVRSGRRVTYYAPQTYGLPDTNDAAAWTALAESAT